MYMIVMRAGTSMSQMPQENLSRNRFRRDVGGEAEGRARQNNEATPGVLSARPWEALSLCNRAISICEYKINSAINRIRSQVHRLVQAAWRGRTNLHACAVRGADEAVDPARGKGGGGGRDDEEEERTRQGRHLHFADDVGELVDKQPLLALPLHPATCPHTETHGGGSDMAAATARGHVKVEGAEREGGASEGEGRQTQCQIRANEDKTRASRARQRYAQPPSPPHTHT